MRCPDCNKFVSNEPRAEWDSEPTIDGDEVSGTVRIVLECAECSTELAETTVDFCEPLPEGVVIAEGEEPEISYDDPEPSDVYVGSDKNGKPYSARYQKHMYYATADITITDSEGTEHLMSVETDQVQGSAFDELN